MPHEFSLSQVKITPRHLERKHVISFNELPASKCGSISTVNSRSAPWSVGPNTWVGISERIEVFDGDLGPSAAGSQERDDFQALAAEVAVGHVGIVFGRSRVWRATIRRVQYQFLD